MVVNRLQHREPGRNAPSGPAVVCPIVVATPNLETYSSHTGIGRVLHSLCEYWGDRIRLASAHFTSVPLPILRNNPTGVRAHGSADLVLIPQLTGAQALRDSQGLSGLVIVHDVGIVDFPGDREGLNWITRWSVRQSLGGLRHARRIVTDSDFTQRRLLHYLPAVADRTTTIHCGVNDRYVHFTASRDVSRSVLASHVGHRLGEPLAIAVGTEHPRKNMTVLLDAFKRIKAWAPNAQLLKVGRAGSERWRERTARTVVELGLRMDDDVLIVEDIDDSMLAHAYRAADVYLSASLYEGFGLPALEAMAIGTPVVVTTRGSFPEIVGNGGMVVDPDPAALASAAISILANPDRAEHYSTMGRQRAMQLRWSTAADRYLNVFEAMLI